MKITTRITWDMSTGRVLEHEFYDYSGPLALADRAAQGRAKSQADTEADLSTQKGQAADTEHSELAPFFHSEMTAQHGFTPGQTNELLTSAEAGGGAAAGDEAAALNRQAARTRNASGFTKSLDEAARDRMKTAAGASEGIAAQDVMGAKALNQEGSAGLMGLFGNDADMQAKALGLENQSVENEINAGKTGWLQNMNDTIAALSGAAKGGSDAFKTMKG